MSDRQPPSWRPASDPSGIEAARGTVRDALGGLRNLEQLLASVRIGPRALSSVLPDSYASCAPLQHAMSELADWAGGQRPDAGPTVEKLRRHSDRHFDELATALGGARKQQMNAKNRLHLEEVLQRTVRDLEAASELLDLLANASLGQAVSLSLREVILEVCRGSEPVGGSLEGIRVTIAPSLAEFEYSIRPKLLVSMLIHAVRWLVARDAHCVPHLELDTHGASEARLTIVPGQNAGEVRWVAGRRTLALAADCLAIGAKAAAVDLSVDEDSHRIVFRFSQ